MSTHYLWIYRVTPPPHTTLRYNIYIWPRGGGIIIGSGEKLRLFIATTP